MTTREPEPLRTEPKRGVITEERPDVRTSHGDGDHERFAHYVDKDKVVESAVTGTPVVALCGKVWVPSRDPQKFPVCPDCQRLYELGPQGRRKEWESRNQD
jgi:hypothetical protein